MVQTRSNNMEDKIIMLLEQISKTNQEIQSVRTSMTEFQSRINDKLQQHEAMFKVLQRQIKARYPVRIPEPQSPSEKPDAFSDSEGAEIVRYQPRRTTQFQSSSVKVDLAHFDGTDLHNWILQAERYFDFYDIEDDDKVRLCPSHFTGTALSWFNWMWKNKLVSTWPKLVKAMEDLFGDDFKEESGKLDEKKNEGINFDAYEDIPVEASGEDVPPPVNAFVDLDLGEGLTQNIERCKYVKPTPIQRHAIPIAIAGRDLIACAQTGSGKTAAFCFPIISGILNGGGGGGGRNAAAPLALILSPTRELASQIYEEAKKFGFRTGLRIVVVYGGAPVSQQLRELKKGVNILVATPGRLVDIIDKGRVSLRMIKYLTLDEADRMLDMGFEPQIRKIVERSGMPPSGIRQTMLFSATFPDEIQKLASDFLSNYIFISVGRVGSSTDLIKQKVEMVKDIDKRDRLMDLLHAQNTKKAYGKLDLTLIFVETKRGADKLEKWLSEKGFPATAIHGDKMQMEREAALRSFKDGSCPIMVATDVAARGLDIPYVAHVINYDFPKNINDYVHRIGRTGRAGKSGLATAFFNDQNFPLTRALVDLMEESKQDIPPWLVDCAKDNANGFGDRGSRSTGRKFGGADFRKAGRFRSEDISSYSYNYNDSSNWNLDSNSEPYAYANNIGDDYQNVDAGSYGDRNGNWDTDVKPHSSANIVNQNYVENIGASNAEYDPLASEDYKFGYESIAATGWD